MSESESRKKQDFSLSLILIFFSIWLLWWFWLNTVGRLPSGLRWPSLLAFDGIALAFATFAWRKWQPVRPEKFPLSVWHIPAGISLASAIFYCSILLPIDWDGLTYHLPPVIEAYQKGLWGKLDNPFFAVQAYFKLVESLYLFFILHFGPHGYLFLGLIPIITGAWAVNRLCKCFSINGDWAVALWCTYPIIVKQAQSLYVDGFIATFGVCATLAIYLRRLDLFSVSLALFIGSKPSAFVPGALLLVSWTIRQWRADGISLRSIPWTSLGLSVLACMGSFIPNFLRYSNPIYPFQVSLFGRVIFPGFSNAAAPGDYPSYPLHLSQTSYLERINYTYLKSPPVPFWDMIQGAMGFPLFILGMLGLGFVLIRTIRKRQNPLTMPGLEFAANIPVAQAIWMPRYHEWMGGGLAVWASELISSLPRFLRGAVWFVLLLQSFWLWTDRVWMMGKKPEWEHAIHTRDWTNIRQLIASRWQELREYGEPQEAKEPWDLYRINSRKKKGPFYVCDDGPQMIGALYGNDFKNQVIWVPKGDLPGKCDQGIWIPNDKTQQGQVPTPSQGP